MYTKRLNETQVEEAAAILKNGGLLGIPTETVYGLGANGLDERAVARIFEAKGRPQDNPLILHIPTAEWLIRYCKEIPQAAFDLAASFWPGPLTMVLKRRDMVPDRVTAGLDTVGMRCPAHPLCRQVIAVAGVPVAAPSGNTSGRPSPTRVEHMLEDMDGKIDGILDGGPCSVGVESTIVDLTVWPPRLLRPGGITLEQLREVLGNVEVDEAVVRLMEAGEKPRAPGMKYRHYAPKAPVTVVQGVPEQTAAYIQSHLTEKSGVICFDEYTAFFDGHVVETLGPVHDPAIQARKLFDALRAFDHADVSEIWAQGTDEQGLGLAVTNRLNKAAGFHIVHLEKGSVKAAIYGRLNDGPDQAFLDRAAEMIKPCGHPLSQVPEWVKTRFHGEEVPVKDWERDLVRANILCNQPDLLPAEAPREFAPLLEWLRDRPNVAGLDVRKFSLPDGRSFLLEMRTGYGNSSSEIEPVFDEMTLFLGVTEEDIRRRTPRFVAYAYLLRSRGELA